MRWSGSTGTQEPANRTRTSGLPRRRRMMAKVDSVSQFLNWIDNHRYRPTTFTRIDFMGR